MKAMIDFFCYFYGLLKDFGPHFRSGVVWTSLAWLPLPTPHPPKKASCLTNFRQDNYNLAFSEICMTICGKICTQCLQLQTMQLFFIFTFPTTN